MDIEKILITIVEQIIKKEVVDIVTYAFFGAILTLVLKLNIDEVCLFYLFFCLFVAVLLAWLTIKTIKSK